MIKKIDYSSTIQDLEKYTLTHFSLREIRSKGDSLFKGYSSIEVSNIASQLFSSSQYQARMLATYILGKLASQSTDAFELLKKTVSEDTDWRVQELLAMAFDTYCNDRGYEKSLTVIKDWLRDKKPNVRRAVTEGLRIWTSREYFKQHPQVAIDLLSTLKEDDSEYVRKSVGNALRDISKKEKELVNNELKTWNLQSKAIKQTYNLASKFL